MVSGARRAVFLDRDGVLNHSNVIDGRPYAPRRLDDFRLVEDVHEACRRLVAAGFVLVVVTNQPDIGNRLVKPAVVREMNDRLARALPIAAVLCCPHRQTDRCDCRKPKPKLILQAAAEHHIDLARSYFVGDTANDIAAGKAAGCTTVFITPNSQTIQPKSDYVAKNFLEASNLIVRAVGAGLKPDCSDSSRFK